jgi:hypothetical protein
MTETRPSVVNDGSLSRPRTTAASGYEHSSNQLPSEVASRLGWSESLAVGILDHQSFSGQVGNEAVDLVAQHDLVDVELVLQALQDGGVLETVAQQLPLPGCGDVEAVDAVLT